MNPYSVAEDMLFKLNQAVVDERIEPMEVDQVLEQAKIWAILALSTSIDGLGTDIREAARDIATEVGGVSLSIERD